MSVSSVYNMREEKLSRFSGVLRFRFSSKTKILTNLRKSRLTEIFEGFQLSLTCAGEFLRTLEDHDLNVRRVALVAFNSAAHNKPSLIRVSSKSQQIKSHQG